MHSIENFCKEGDFSDLTCENLIIGHGAEDIAVTKDGLAFITSGLMYPPFRLDFDHFRFKNGMESI